MASIVVKGGRGDLTSNKENHLTAIILAAGLSSRMGRFKPLLQLGALTVVERVITLYREAGIPDICVVTGNRAEELFKVLQPHGVRCVNNPDYARGMFSSLVAGVGTLAPDCCGFFVHPVDIALVRPSTPAALIAAWNNAPTSVFHPTFDGRRGHPPLVPATLAPAILKWTGQGGLRTFWETRDALMKEIPVADSAILLDLDTDEDYRLALHALEQEYFPAADACRVLMTQVAEVPLPVWHHCQAAADVAVAMTEAVNAVDGALDLNLVRSAALVHDIAKTRKNHAAAGAEQLTALGYPQIAALVRVHMDIETSADSPLDEAQVVFLADKLIQGNQPVSLEARIARKMAKYGADASARLAIARRFQAARWILAKVERLVGQSVSSMIDRIDFDEYR